MNREKFKKELLENCIFNELKDSCFSGINYIRNKYQGADIDFSKVYRRIVNYQVKNYGYNLYKAKSFKLKEECKRESMLSAQRKYQRTHR